MKNNRIVRLITGLILLAVFAAVLIGSIRNYDLDRLLQDAQPKTVVVTVEVTVTPGVSSTEGSTVSTGCSGTSARRRVRGCTTFSRESA